MKLGLVTYNLAHDWDLPALIERCEKAGFEGVELRTTHRHGVEPSLSPSERREVRDRFADSGVTLWGLGSICDFHDADPAAVQANIETCKAFVELAADLGATGVKVRPNGLQTAKGISEEDTLRQIADALRECGTFGTEHGVEIWLEVHGHETQHPPRIRAILDQCGHPNVGACWNSNDEDLKDGQVQPYFDLLKDNLRSCHINELWSDYPWRDLFTGLRQHGYDRFTLAEIPHSSDPERVMRYYRALWNELTRPES
jgi:sugar phosphate isomerase/epimerase